jgi:hypothetical protein
MTAASSENWSSLLIEHADEHYIQSWSATGRPVEVEHRDGGPDRHFHATTTDRALVHAVAS